MKNIIKLSALCAASLSTTIVLAQESPSSEEMWSLIKEQQEQITELKAELDIMKGDVSETKIEVQETREQIEATADVVDEVALSVGENTSIFKDTTIGGYGELHLNFKSGRNNNTIDYHRWVLFFGHEYNDRIRMFSEFELEHSISGDGQDGEVELEQAYIEMDLSETYTLKTGLFLMPVGILNETHEPNTFFGVERNLVEKRIIPTTWWEAGLNLNTKFENGLSFDVAMTSGLDNSDGVIRSGREKVSNAPASSPLFTGRVKYTGIAGLELAATLMYQGDMSQQDTGEDDGKEIEAFLYEMHAVYKVGGFALKALYAQWILDGDIPESAEDQFGYYIEPSYIFKTNDFGDLGVFARFSRFEYQNKADSFRTDEITTLGLNYWPIESVVFKFDYQMTQNSDELDGDNNLNLGLGYSF